MNRAIPMFGYGVTNRKLSESVLAKAFRYAKLRLSKWTDLHLSEAIDYGVIRSTLHNRIAEALDCDRELVEEAFTKAAEPLGCKAIDGFVVDGTLENDEDFNKVFDVFCDNLAEIALRENPEDRHPSRITYARLDEIANNPPLGIPSISITEGGDHA